MRIEDSIYQYGSIFKPIEKTRQQTSEGVNPNEQVPKQSFEDLLKQKMQASELTFSKHAMQRLEQRDIKLSPEDIQKMSTAVNAAKEKGVENTLLLSQKGAFIINVSSQVVITALSGNDMIGNIFTQIDGAVVI